RLIVATLVNRFQGDPALFADGRLFIEARTGLPCLGPVPHFPGAVRLPAEDVLALDAPQPAGQGAFTIAVPRLPRIANFDDLDPLRAEPGVSLHIVEPGQPIPPVDLIILPGSKATRADLAALRAEGWDIDILAHHRRGGAVLGICGGYQMLGTAIADPDGIEGAPGSSRGLGLLVVETRIGPLKQLRLEGGVHATSGEPLTGFHMHMGETAGADRGRPFARVAGEPEGAVSASGAVTGTYLHGLFAADGFRAAFLRQLGAARTGETAYEAGVDATLDQLAAHLERHLDLDAILALARTPEPV